MILKETVDSVQKEKMEAYTTEDGKKYQDSDNDCEVDWMPDMIRIIVWFIIHTTTPLRVKEISVNNGDEMAGINWNCPKQTGMKCHSRHAGKKNQRNLWEFQWSGWK